MNRVLFLYGSILIGLFISVESFGQKSYSLPELFELLENQNYSLQLSQKAIELEEHNNTIWSKGYLPTLSLNASGSYNLNGNKTTDHQDAITNEFQNANVKSAVGVAKVDYLLYNGSRRKLTNASNALELANAKLDYENNWQTQKLILSSIYYQIAKLEKNKAVLLENLSINTSRLNRAIIEFDHGRSTRLAQLNAEVDMRNDSIEVLKIDRSITNLKSDIAYLVNLQDNKFDLDASLVLAEGLSLENCLSVCLEKNLDLASLRNDTEINENNIKSAEALLYPELSISSSYQYLLTDNDENYGVNRLINNNWESGLALRMNIFDGGIRKTAIAKARTGLMINQLQISSLQNELKTEVNQAWQEYSLQKEIMRTSSENIRANEANFERTVSRHEQGQVSSVEFRQAQLNLMRAKITAINARYDTKLAELELKRLMRKL